MPLAIHTIKPGNGATKKRKRVGRGNSSGHGTYSTRGLKGQKSRSGVSGLKRIGMKQMLRRIPKKRGFSSLRADNQPVNLADINRLFKDGEVVNAKALLKKGLVAKIKLPIKILGTGELERKGLVFEDVKISAGAREKIAKAGGEMKAK